MSKPVDVTRDDVLTLVCIQLGCAAARMDDRIVENLGAESLDVLNLLVAVEIRYGVTIDEERAYQLATVEDLFREISERRSTLS